MRVVIVWAVVVLSDTANATQRTVCFTMAAQGGNIIRYIYRGEGNIPDDVTHVFVEKIAVVPESAFDGNPNIVEVIFDEDVEKVEEYAFAECYNLRRVIMRGVGVVEGWAFFECTALTDVECGKLEIIKEGAFGFCHSLRSINLPSAKIVENAFSECKALTDVNFGTKLESIRWTPFRKCFSLERITIPLKNGLIDGDGMFSGCRNLKRVDLVEGAVLHETVAALQLEEWKNDMNEEIVSINQILPDADGGYGEGGMITGLRSWNYGDKALVIRTWIRSVLRKMIHYKAEHCRVLKEAATTLQLALPKDIVKNNVLRFLELPSHTFDGEDKKGD